MLGVVVSFNLDIRDVETRLVKVYCAEKWIVFSSMEFPTRNTTNDVSGAESYILLSWQALFLFRFSLAIYRSVAINFDKSCVWSHLI